MTARFFAQWESGLLSDDMRSSLLQMEYLTEAESDVQKDPAQGSGQQRRSRIKCRTGDAGPGCHENQLSLMLHI